MFVDSQPDRGSTFRVLLPRTESPPPLAAPSVRPVPTARAAATVLLVEDDPAVRQLARTFLDNAGFHVAVAASPAEAMELAAPPDWAVDILVTDVIMPGMNGRELARRLHEDRPGLRVLYISGYASTILPKLPDLEPSEGFLQKPFQGEELVEKVSGLLER